MRALRHRQLLGTRYVLPVWRWFSATIHITHCNLLTNGPPDLRPDGCTCPRTKSEADKRAGAPPYTFSDEPYPGTNSITDTSF